MPEVELEPLPAQQNPVESRELKRRTSNWTFLPYELWLNVLVDYGLTSKDLINLDYCCKWFGSSSNWQGEINTQPAELAVLEFVIPARVLSMRTCSVNNAIKSLNWVIIKTPTD